MRRTLASLTAMALVLLLGQIGAAQDRRNANAGRDQDAPAQKGSSRAAAGPEAGDPADTLVLVFPSGDRATGTLLLEAFGPRQVPVGQPYDYRIRVTNISRSLVLEDVQVHQTPAKGFSVEKSQPKPDQDQGQDGRTTWTVDRLNPGQARTITVTGLADQEGGAAFCLQVDYKPSLCLAGLTTFVKPELQVTKAAPEQADLCEMLTFRYTVLNTGSGMARAPWSATSCPRA
ncbi:MAG TPA: hypothetical protein VF590_08940 [Isosphaeraceae bacterium]